MEKILLQLRDLVLGALPTTVIVLFLYLFLRWVFWQPLVRVLAERQAATEGTRREAEEILQRANERLRQYEEALRHARAETYQQQQASRRLALEERSQILRDTRERAQELVRQAKLDIAGDVTQAKKELHAESQRLAEEITRTLLAPAPPGGARPEGSPRGGRA